MLEPAAGIVRLVSQCHDDPVLADERVAEICGVTTTTVWRWQAPRPIGTGGEIPRRYMAPLLAYCRRRKIDLDISAFYAMPEAIKSRSKVA